jgi:hypothetical protein
MMHPRESTLQRIQVGLIGLVIVLLFVSVANMALDKAIDNAPSASGGGVTGTEIASEPKEKAGQPLAELGGVVPATDNAAAKAPAKPNANGQ